MMKFIFLFAILLGFCSASSNESNHGPDEDGSGNPRISFSEALHACSLDVDDLSTEVPSSAVSESGDRSDEEEWEILPKTLTPEQRLPLLIQAQDLLVNTEIAMQQALKAANLDLMYRISLVKERALRLKEECTISLDIGQIISSDEERALSLTEELFVSPEVVEIESNQGASRMESLMQYMSAIKANSGEKLRSYKEKAQPGIDLLNEYSAELLSWLASKTSEGMSFAREKAGEGLSFAGNKAAEGLTFAGQVVSGLASDAGDALLSFLKEHILDPRDASEVRNRIGENFGELKDVFSTTLQDIRDLWAASFPAVKQDIWTILETIYQRNLVNSDISLDTNNAGIAQRWPISSSLGSILGITAYNSFWTSCNIANGIRKSVVPAGRFSYNVASFGYKKISGFLRS